MGTLICRDVGPTSLHKLNAILKFKLSKNLKIQLFIAACELVLWYCSTDQKVETMRIVWFWVIEGQGQQCYFVC